MKKKITAKRFTCLVLLLAMVLTAMPPVTAYAGKGPSSGKESYAYIMLSKGEGDSQVNTYIYASDVIKASGKKTSKVKGVTYSKKTNTLTLNNYSDSTMRIDVNEMGEDFKVNVKGKNNIQSLTVWGYFWGGGLQLTGKGTLNVNKNKKMDTAIMLVAEYSKSAFVCDKDVKLNAYAKSSSDYSICVRETTKKTKGIVFTGKAALNKKVKTQEMTTSVWIDITYEGMDYKCALAKKDGKEYALYSTFDINDDGLFVTLYHIFEVSEVNGTYTVVQELDPIETEEFPSGYTELTQPAGVYIFWIKGTVKK